MAELDEKLAAMMADPNIMAQVAAMAKSLGMAPPGPGETPPESPVVEITENGVKYLVDVENG